jgi:hypothetical protein
MDRTNIEKGAFVLAPFRGLQDEALVVVHLQKSGLC